MLTGSTTGLGQWKHAHIPTYELPKAEDDHGWMKMDGFLEPVWSQHAHVPTYELPKAEDDHGWMKMDGFLEPVWSRGPILPPPPFPGGPLGPLGHP